MVCYDTLSHTDISSRTRHEAKAIVDVMRWRLREEVVLSQVLGNVSCSILQVRDLRPYQILWLAG